MVEDYDAMKRERPAVTVDIIIFTVRDNDLKALLVKRKYEPCKEMWALPGGFVKIDENLEDAAKRELLEETGVKDVYLEQLYTFGDVRRDSRGRVITVAYFALIDSSNVKLNATSDASEAQWFSAHSLPKIAFDHGEILKYAMKRLRWKLEYTTVGFKLLPKNFTLGQLQSLYEKIMNQKFDKRNFRKKILSLGLIEETAEVTENVSHRPAKLYTLKKKIGEIVDIL